MNVAPSGATDGWMVINGSLCGVRYRTPCGANKGILRVQFGKLHGFVTNLYAGEYLGRKQMRFWPFAWF